MDIADTFGHLILGTLFAIYGAWYIARQHGAIGIGRPPAVFVHVEGIAASVLGWSGIIAGAMTLTPFVLVVLGVDVSEGAAYWLPMLGIGVIVVGLFLSFVIQAAVTFGRRMRPRKHALKKDK